MSDPARPTPADEHKPSNFLRQIIERDLAQGTYANRHFAGTPGDAKHHAAGPLDPAKIRTRFPPEPNGYLHIGHAKSICLNFGLARDYGGICHMRFDDTNPEKEEQEYVDSILDAVKWLGFDWNVNGTSHLFYASHYFDFMYRAAEALINAGLAYVDEQTAEQMRANRGDFGTPGTDSPYRGRTPAENLARFREMRDGKLADGAAVLRAKIDMASPNINLRDPALYRIKRATHHNTGDTWCIYPMYTYAHPIEDALEQITHSICTLEFEDQRPFYDWLLDKLCELGLLAQPRPHQYEFARLNLTYIITSKRKLKQLVDENHVSGWDDPRLPTIVGLRRRGYTPESLQLLAERSGVSKAGGWIDYSSLEIALRDDLDPKAPRACAVLDPLKLKLVNFAEIFGNEAHQEPCHAPVHPAHPDRGQRQFTLTNEVWIEREDFMETPPKGYHRLYPGNKARLKYGYVIECTGCEKNAQGEITAVLAKLVPDTKSGTPGADAVKVKGVITWVSVATGIEAEVRLYDRLFTEAQPDAGGRDFLSVLNPNSKKVVTAYLEPGVAAAKADDKFQFERHGYFVADRHDHRAGKPVFNRATTLKDTWSK
ncbi:glutamine--tRNA ligase/YqeY domain fusion protein [Piscinibacter sp. HJYY11]|uniref:glutamine--tRNA ligase/YqeY domain fusion protein n=1 Tax=Piscinibacter sp. HJYY11 TaxID=2801333 RepID=UPI00191F5C55|nr:glutamine--tRNA ligase/YqeY domain fusion protein [Piscinibacter sp. HJYY11]MBL0727404.1 glutamine--tRNA ligase/YqeY domain fusion protein [Piscinibacter sp. HJYY11]